MSLYIVLIFTDLNDLKKEPQGQFKKESLPQKSEREIERERGGCPWCWWLRGGLELCFRTFSNFRREATETQGGSGAFWFITCCKV